MALVRQENSPTQLLLGDNKFQPETFLSTGAITLPAGTMLGRITASGKVREYASGSADGSEVPIGVITYGLVIAGAGDTSVSMCIGGDLRQDTVTAYNGGTPAAATTVEREHLRDYGIRTVAVSELQEFDN